MGSTKVRLGLIRDMRNTKSCILNFDNLCKNTICWTWSLFCIVLHLSYSYFTENSYTFQDKCISIYRSIVIVHIPEMSIFVKILIFGNFYEKYQLLNLSVIFFFWCAKYCIWNTPFLWIGSRLSNQGLQITYGYCPHKNVLHT